MTRAIRIAFLLLCLGPAFAARAQPAAPAADHDAVAPMAGHDAVAPGGRGVVIQAGSGRVVSLAGAAASVFAADPKVAEVRPASPTSLFVFGVAPGRTTVAAMDAAGKVIAQYEVTVRPSDFAASEVGATLRHELPGSNVAVQATPNGLALTGRVASPEQADRAASVVRGYLQPKQTLSNQLSVSAPVQVSLRVRIAEMSRSVVRELGVNWTAMGTIGKYAISGATSNGLATAATAATTIGVSYANKGINLSTLIDALATDELVHVLAEPTLTAMSGETASFLVGGEFPIPISQQNNEVSVEFKQYGISLAFVPTVLNDGRISLRVRPEVSQLTNQGAVQLQAGNASLQIPALTVRRADTTVTLGSGQTFAVAGLLSDSTTQDANALPWLGEIPIIGALFRSTSFQRNETELVIVVTPYIVNPISESSAVSLPTDGYVVPNDLERLLLLRQIGSGPPTAATRAVARIPGSAGFIVQ